MTSIKMHCVFQALTGISVMLAFSGLVSSPVRAQTIQIRVIDGRNGHPISGERLQVSTDPNFNNWMQSSTSSDGIATVDVGGGKEIKIASNLFYDCRPFQKDVPRPVYSVAEILNTGAATANACGKLKVEPKRGELLFFVRPLHWWEGIRR
jgi:hypothetical protein